MSLLSDRWDSVTLVVYDFPARMSLKMKISFDNNYTLVLLLVKCHRDRLERRERDNQDKSESHESFIHSSSFPGKINLTRLCRLTD